MLNNLVRGSLLALALATSSMVVGSVSQAQDVHVPTTVEDHLALAKTYQDKAVTYRKEASYHREMFDAYKKSVPTAGKAPGPNPWVVKMHARKYAYATLAPGPAPPNMVASFTRSTFPDEQGSNIRHICVAAIGGSVEDDAEIP